MQKRMGGGDAARQGGRAPKLSFGSWAFAFGPFEAAPWSFEQVCRYAAEAGYDGIEINGFRPHPHHADFDDDSATARLRSLIAGYGLEPAAYAPDLTSVPPRDVPRAAYLAEIDAALRFCERMGIRILRVDTVSPPLALDPRVYEARFATLVETWRAAAERCHRAGVTLVWEFEPGFWLNRPSEVVRVAEEIGTNGFKLLFDTSHAHMGAVAGARQTPGPETLEGGAAEYARLLAPHVGHLHLIDSNGSLHDDETSEHVPFGEGDVDFRSVLSALGPALDGLEWWGIDFCFCPTTERDGRKAVPFVRDLVAAEAVR
jgi:sugar phosphate isomerase/epimerase